MVIANGLVDGLLQLVVLKVGRKGHVVEGVEERVAALVANDQSATAVGEPEEEEEHAKMDPKPNRQTHLATVLKDESILCLDMGRSRLRRKSHMLADSRLTATMIVEFVGLHLAQCTGVISSSSSSSGRVMPSIQMRTYLEESGYLLENPKQMDTHQSLPQVRNSLGDHGENSITVTPPSWQRRTSRYWCW